MEGNESQSSDSIASPIASIPSLSAAQLAGDSSVTVQAALAGADNSLAVIDTVTAGDSSGSVETVVNTGDSTNALIPPVINTDTSNSENTPTVDTGVETGNVGNLSPSDTSSSDTSPSDTSPSDTSPSDTSPSDTSSSDTSPSDTSSSDTSPSNTSPSNTSPSDTSTPDTSSSDNADLPAETYFTSVTTPGFEGEIQDDSIRITWAEDPDAYGYNVYRQADYYTTVFSTEFLDTDVFDDDYYYEIQAFDAAEGNERSYWYIATGLTVSARTFGRTDPDVRQPKEDLLEDYALVFADEFNNVELDKSKWNTSFLWGTDEIINYEEQYYVDIANEPDFGFNPFTFDGNHLTINTIETPDELLNKANNQPYLSGIITSYDAFKFIYGYVETRAKLTHGRGYWPAFWLLNARYVDAEPEIDIMEFIGHNQDVIYHTYHYYDAEGNLRSTDSFPVPGIDYTEDFHTFGVEWMPGILVFYVDGIETNRIIDTNVSQQEMYVIANQAVGGWWAGSPDETTPLPGEYVIDYIRVYQRTTPYEIIEFDQSTDIIPLFTEERGTVLPNKRPSEWLQSQDYPR